MAVAVEGQTMEAVEVGVEVEVEEAEVEIEAASVVVAVVVAPVQLTFSGWCPLLAFRSLSLTACLQAG